MHTWSLYIYILILTAFTGCQTVQVEEKPEDLIPEDQMIEILSDITVLRATKGTNRKTLLENHINLTEYISNKHGIDSSTFEASNLWYSKDLRKYRSMFRKIRAHLKEQKEFYKELSEEQDSIDKANGVFSSDHYSNIDIEE